MFIITVFMHLFFFCMIYVHTNSSTIKRAGFYPVLDKLIDFFFQTIFFHKIMYFLVIARKTQYCNAEFKTKYNYFSYHVLLGAEYCNILDDSKSAHFFSLY